MKRQQTRSRVVPRESENRAANRQTDVMDTLLSDAMIEKATAAQFYTELLNDAPRGLHAELIEKARDDELMHLSDLSDLYRFLFSRDPDYGIEVIRCADYGTGLGAALKNALDSSAFCRDMALSDHSFPVREIFHRAMIDELRHATLFGALYASPERP